MSVLWDEAERNNGAVSVFDDAVTLKPENIELAVVLSRIESR